MMTRFDFDGKVYEFDSRAAKIGTGLIKLPDGRIIQPSGWFETLPPQPAGLRDAGFLPGVIGDDQVTMAVEVEPEE